MTLAAAAAEYLSAGLEVIALVGKMPNTRWHPRGLLDALKGTPEGDDFAVLDRYFAEPTTGIGLLVPPGMLVADVDTDEAARVLLDLMGEYPDTPTAQTPNGLHVWLFAGYDTGSVWFEGRTLLMRGRGSYLAAPPSVHPSGKVYEWLLPLINEHGVVNELAPVSPAIGTALQLRAAAENLRTTLAPAAADKGTIAVTLDPLTFVWEQNITGLVRTVQDAPEGNRNNVLAWASMTAAEDGVSLNDALPQLLEAALKAGLDRREAQVTIKAAFARVARRG